MTEAQLKSYAEFQTLPIYDESDERSVAITNASGEFRRIRECSTLQAVAESLANVHLVPLGALRVKIDGGCVVVALFGESE